MSLEVTSEEVHDGKMLKKLIDNAFFLNTKGRAGLAYHANGRRNTNRRYVINLYISNHPIYLPSYIIKCVDRFGLFPFNLL